MFVIDKLDEKVGGASQVGRPAVDRAATCSNRRGLYTSLIDRAAHTLHGAARRAIAMHHLIAPRS
jgi:hypothetical protein